MPIYDVSTVGTSLNEITFNDDSANPFYRMKRRSVTRREIEEFDIKLPEGTGDADFQSYIGKSYTVLEGTMYPDDETSFDNGKKALRKLASLATEQADANSDQGYVPMKWPENDGYNKQLFVKVMYVDIPESSANGLKLPFRLVCKVKYPVIFGQTQVTTSIGSAAASTSGGVGYPFNYPVAYGATTYSSSGSIVNAGDLPTYPTIQVIGPITLPRVTNSTTGEYIEFNVSLATTSDSIIITYDQDTFTATQAGNSVMNGLTSGSTLFTVRPGTNNLTLSGATVGTGSYATMSIFPAWSLS